MQKKNREGTAPLPSKDSLPNRLEFKSQTQPHTERTVERSRLEEVRIHSCKIQFLELSWESRFPAVENIEEVRDELQLRRLSDAHRVVRVNVKASVSVGTTQLAAPPYRDFPSVEVDGVRQEFTDRQSGLHVNIESEIQTIQPVKTALFTEGIAAKHVNDVFAVGVEWSDGELIAEQIEVTSGEVKQRADCRVGLSVVIAQVAFEVALQRGYAPVGEALPAV